MIAVEQKSRRRPVRVGRSLDDLFVHVSGGKEMFTGIGIPEIVTGVLIGIATVGIVLFWRSGAVE